MPSSPTRHRLALALALAGVALSALTLDVHRRLAAGSGYTSFCNLGGVVNCDAVLGSRYSVVLGAPVPAWGIAGFVAGAALALTVPALIQLLGRWHLLRRWSGKTIAYGVIGVAACQLGYFNAIERMPVGVALLLEGIEMVLQDPVLSGCGHRSPPRIHKVPASRSASPRSYRSAAARPSAIPGLLPPTD